MNIEFKKFFKKTILFLLLLVLFDFVFGYFTKEIFFSQKTGKYARVVNTIQQDDSEILIMGSSHANRHYIPKILEEKLNMTCYNAGVQGQYIIFQTALLKMILKNHSPKLIILNVDDWWMYKSDEAYERLADLYPYYWDYREEIEPILALNPKFRNFKMLSTAYQTNSTIVHAIKYFLQPQKDYDGYIPLYHKMEVPETIKPEDRENTGEIDNNFVTLLEDFIHLANDKNVDLILILSPIAVTIDREKFNYESFEMMKSMADKHNIPFIDFTNNDSFVEQYELFNDYGHLNNDGAILFSKIVGEKIKEIMNE